MPLEQMVLSPQCGFSSTVYGNDIAFDSQAAKLRLVTEVAQDEWELTLIDSPESQSRKIKMIQVPEV